MTGLAQASATPILDLENPLPFAGKDALTRSELTGILVAALSGIAALILTWKNLPLFFLSLVLLGAPLIWLITTAIHETGHLIAGFVVGFRFRSLAIGPLRIEHMSRTWRFRSRRALLTGAAHMVPDRIRRVRQRLVFFTAGGPAATALSASFAFAVMARLDDGALRILVSFFAFLQAYDVILGLLPVQGIPGVHEVTDGTWLRTLLSSREGARELVARIVLDMLRNSKVDRLRWNPRWIKEAHVKAALSDQGFVQDWNAYASAETATIKGEHLERCLAASGSLWPERREQVIVEAAYFTAWWRDDAARADVWLGRTAHPENVSRYSVMRAQVALHCARRQFDEALECWERGLVWLQSLPEPWVRRFEHGWIEWRVEVEKRRAERSLAEQTSATQQA